MTLWMVRGDKYGQYQNLALEKGFAYHFSQVPDLSKAKSRKEVLEIQRNARPEAKDAQLRSWAAQLFTISHRIKEGDLLAMPLKNSPQIAIGRVIGPYKYRTDLGDIHHTIPVEWLRDNVPRTDFKQDLLYSLGSARTICKIERNNAELRIKEILKRSKDADYPSKEEEIVEPGEIGEEGDTDVEQMARDQIMHYIEKSFTGHDLSRLVNAVLKAEGYITELSSPGPDGGVDILAGKGTFGFQEPRLCVQVKSSKSPADVTILRTLQGTMQNFKAEQGLLVSWGGFNKTVEKEARLSFFSVRLWDADDLIEAVLKNYDHLPEELQNELPLKRIWALVIEE